MVKTAVYDFFIFFIFGVLTPLSVYEMNLL